MKNCTNCNTIVRNFIYEGTMNFHEYEKEPETFDVRICDVCATLILPNLIGHLVGREFTNFIKTYGQKRTDNSKKNK